MGGRISRWAGDAEPNLCHACMSMLVRYEHIQAVAREHLEHDTHTRTQRTNICNFFLTRCWNEEWHETCGEMFVQEEDGICVGGFTDEETVHGMSWHVVGE